jgi:hypothetical protein
LKRAISGVMMAAALLGLLACGGSSTSAPSGLTNRVFVSNALGPGNLASGGMDIIDATHDTISGTTITTGTSPGVMALSPERDRTLVYDSGSDDVSILVNSSESDVAFITMPDFIENNMPGGLIARDTNIGLAAVPNVNLSGQASLGAVFVLDLVNAQLPITVPVPLAHRMVINSASKVLVFSDGNAPFTTPAASCTTATAVTVLDVSQPSVSASNTTFAGSVPTPTVVCGFDHPQWAVFSSDGNTAYVLNCGPECGGTTASIQALDMTTSPPTPKTPVPVAATIAELNGNTLYVAGTPGGATGSGKGTLNAFTVSGTTITPVASVQNVSIGDGFHTRMAFASNNKLFVGAIDCTDNDPDANHPTGCLTIFDTSANTAVIDHANGFVTGMAPLSGRSVAYVVEGGKLQVYDTTTSAVSTSIFINLVGNLVDLKAVDQVQQ